MDINDWFADYSSKNTKNIFKHLLRTLCNMATAKSNNDKVTYKAISGRLSGYFGGTLKIAIHVTVPLKKFGKVWKSAFSLTKINY